MTCDVRMITNVCLAYLGVCECRGQIYLKNKLFIWLIMRTLFHFFIKVVHILHWDKLVYVNDENRLRFLYDLGAIVQGQTNLTYVFADYVLILRFVECSNLAHLLPFVV